MRIRFKLYAGDEVEFDDSTLFDLISGDGETKQTKGLAYLFSRDLDFMKAFLRHDSILEKIPEALRKATKLKNATTLEISAEKFSSEGDRADIIIKIDEDGRPALAFLIEAKGLGVLFDRDCLKDQIDRYLQPDAFPGLAGYIIIPCVLTSVNYNLEGVVNLTWVDVMDLLVDGRSFDKTSSSDLAAQYLNFLFKIQNNMNYYQEEVLSVSAGVTIGLIEAHGVYVTPNSGSRYNFRKSLYVAFRSGGGGAMNRLYKMLDVVVLNARNAKDLSRFRDSNYPEERKSRILSYILAAGELLGDGDHRYYVLSAGETIELVNKPRPPRNNTGPVYYSLADVLAEKVVRPVGQRVG